MGSAYSACTRAIAKQSSLLSANVAAAWQQPVNRSVVRLLPGYCRACFRSQDDDQLIHEILVCMQRMQHVCWTLEIGKNNERADLHAVTYSHDGKGDTLKLNIACVVLTFLYVP